MVKTKETNEEFCIDKVRGLIERGEFTKYLEKKLPDYAGPGLDWAGNPTLNLLETAVIFPEYEYRVVMLSSGLVYTVWNTRQGMSGFRPLKPHNTGNSQFIYAIRCGGKTLQVSVKKLRERAFQIWLDSRRLPEQDTTTRNAGSSPDAASITEYAEVASF